MYPRVLWKILTLFLLSLTLLPALSTPAHADEPMRNLLASAADQHGAGFSDVELASSLGHLNMAFLTESTGLPDVFDIDAATAWALDHNRELERLRLEIQASGDAVRGTSLLYYPTLDFGARSMSVGPASSMQIPGADGQTMEIETSSTDITSTLSLTLTQPVYMFGTFRLARQSASLGLDQSRLTLARAEQTVRRQAEEAFLQAALAESLRLLSVRAVENAEERLRLANVRFDAGDVARFETLRAEVAVATSREQLLQAETASELAMSALVRTMGLPAGTQIVIEPPDPSTVEPLRPSMTLAEAQEAANSYRLDLRTLEIAAELAGIGIETQRNRPALTFQGNYSRSDRALGFGDNESWSLTMNLAYTLFDSGRADVARDEARSRRDALLVQIEDTRTFIALEVESAYRDLVATLERIEVARRTLVSATEALRIAELGYREGVITYIDYKDADLGYVQAETLHLQSVYGYLAAESALRAAMGVDELP